jgi:fusaric acid resistance family protein
MLAILQTATAAVAAYYVALLLPLDDNTPVFASIAAVISIGASYHERGRRAVELVAGVVLGLTVADLIIHAIGTGPLQIGLMIIIAMSAAVVLGGGELLVSEAAVSALLLASLERTSSGYSPDRFIEAVVGGVVAIAVGSVFFPPDPALIVGRAAQAVFADLGETLEDVAAALEHADSGRAEEALRTARGLSGDVAALEEAVDTAREMVRFAPPRRGARSVLQRHAGTLPHVDFAVRDTGVLARHALRYTRSRLVAPDGLIVALRELEQAVWALAGAYDDPQRATEANNRARVAAARAREAFEAEPDLALTEIIGQVRSTAVDVMRAAEVIAGAVAPSDEMPTDEMLAAPPD